MKQHDVFDTPAHIIIIYLTKASFLNVILYVYCTYALFMLHKIKTTMNYFYLHDITNPIYLNEVENIFRTYLPGFNSQNYKGEIHETN